ncbi:MAG: ribosomal protein S18-alanine N-acetyltransferase [Nitrospiraceae bacterium]
MLLLPWTRKMLSAELSGNPFANFLVARTVGFPSTPAVIAGYFCFWIVFEELRLMNLAVVPEFRRRGVARQLVCAALRMGLAKGATRAMLEVRASNQEAQALYRKVGFRQTSTRVRYYVSPEEDAVLMDLIPLRLDAPCLAGQGSHTAPGSTVVAI